MRSRHIALKALCLLFCALFCVIQISGCSALAVFQPTSSAAAVQTVRTLPPRPSNTPILPTPKIHAEDARTFVYFNSCFDLDTGVGSGGQARPCDFSLHRDPGGSEETILFFPVAPARFDLGQLYPDPPGLVQCQESTAFDSARQAFVPHLAYYLCYRTDEGRFGYMNFISVQDSGIQLEWRTFEAGLLPQITPSATPVPPRSSGQNQALVLQRVFDLDNGQVLARDDSNGDLSMFPGAGEQSPQVLALEPARLLNTGSFNSSPTLKTCQNALQNESSSEVQLTPPLLLFYQTGEGRCGYLRLYNNDDNELVFDWLTFEALFELPSDDPTPTPPPFTMHDGEQGKQVYFMSCFDLDDGQELGREIPSCDFSIYRGPNGSSEWVEFLPYSGALFGFGQGLRYPPDYTLCQESTWLSGNVRTFQPDEEGYICYRTGDGRLGYLGFVGSDSNGILIDWQTFDPPIEATFPMPAAQVETAPDGLQPPTGEAMWQDDFTNAQNWNLYSNAQAGFNIDNNRLLMISNESENRAAWLAAWPLLADFYLEAHFESGAQCSGLDHYGLGVRAAAQGDESSIANGYFFGVACNGHYFLRAVNGETITSLIPWTASENLRLGARQAQTLGILAKGRRLALFANGQFLAEIEDSTFSAGQFGPFITAVQSSAFSASMNKIAYWSLK